MVEEIYSLKDNSRIVLKCLCKYDKILDFLCEGKMDNVFKFFVEFWGDFII